MDGELETIFIKNIAPKFYLNKIEKIIIALKSSGC